MTTKTAQDVANFMLKRLKEEQLLYQSEIVLEIEEQFGEPHFYINDNGNLAISKKVLEEFKKITPNVIWETGEKAWRFKEFGDELSGRKA